MRVLELRLLKLCKDKPANLLDATLSIEKIRKDMNKSRESLGSRRKDRVTIRDRSDVTILDLARLFDIERRQVLEDEEETLKEQETQLLKDIEERNYFGNSRDPDSVVGSEEDEYIDS